MRYCTPRQRQSTLHDVVPWAVMVVYAMVKWCRAGGAMVMIAMMTMVTAILLMAVAMMMMMMRMMVIVMMMLLMMLQVLALLMMATIVMKMTRLNHHRCGSVSSCRTHRRATTTMTKSIVVWSPSTVLVHKLQP